MINRRNAVKFGAGMSAASLLALAKTATDPIPKAMAEKPWHNTEIYDPVLFAMKLTASFGDACFSELMDYQCAEAMAEYRIATAAFLAAHPQFEHDGFGGLFTAMHEAVSWVSNASFDSGIRVGASIEHLRRSWMAPVGLCPRCYGKGSIGTHAGFAAGGGPACAVCQGSGTIAR